MLFEKETLEKLKRLFEATLIYKSTPVNIEELSKTFNISFETALEVMSELKKDYLVRDGGILIHNRGFNYFFVINPKIKTEFIDYHKIRNYDKYKLTQSQKEVLSLIAYKQPITKIEIDDLRGSDSSNQIKKLLELELIKISGKKDTPGKPSLYSTTENFLKMLGISSLDELPDIKDLDFENKFFDEN
ncbi:MAG: SMC-Scp complex subunit ScpB [Spirochaetes bacterium]|nr:SMC-Scp complex subunit ScpB [Spirochaetota bacterium]